MTLDQWLQAASTSLADNMIPSARLDAEIILAHTINRSRTWIHAHGDELLDPRRQDIADTRIQLRLERTPIAYIVGHKEFYGRLFAVTPDVLIPRPESEAVITIALAWIKTHPSAIHAVDVGTGSGCLGITLKKECPNIDVTLSDTSARALRIAKQNAAQHNATVRAIEGSLLDPYPLSADLILANLPYVDPTWHTSEETAFEPREALFANQDGLALIYELIRQCETKLATTGLVILEADPRQHAAIIDAAHAVGLRQYAVDGFAIGFSRAAAVSDQTQPRS